MLIDKDWAEAQERGRVRTLNLPCAVAAQYDPASRVITVEMNRGFSLSFHKSRAQPLHEATDEQLSEIEVRAPDWSIFFPRLEDGLSVEGMLAGHFGSRRWERSWAQELGVQIAENMLLDEGVKAEAA